MAVVGWNVVGFGYPSVVGNSLIDEPCQLLNTRPESMLWRLLIRIPDSIGHFFFDPALAWNLKRAAIDNSKHDTPKAK